MMAEGRVALVHDQLEQDGGAERVLWSLHRMFPEAPIFTAMWHPRRAARFVGCDVRTTWMQDLPGIQRLPRAYAALYPLAFASLRVEGYDTVISSSSYFAKGVHTDRRSRHIAYCHTPSNFIWRSSAYTARRPLAISAPLRAWLKAWDRRAARKPDVFVANSPTVAERIRRFYGRDAIVVPPPVDEQWFTDHQADDFFLTVGRLVRSKRHDIAIGACAKLGVPLWIAGVGREESRLRREAPKTAQFLGQVSDRSLRDLYARARAVIVAAEEDFGLVAVEAQAAGTPVIAYDAGGARETVLHGVTGWRFQPQTAEALEAAIKAATSQRWDRTQIQAHAASFGERRFRDGIRAAIDRARSSERSSGRSPVSSV